MKQEAITKDTKLDSGYKWGFETDIKSEKIPKGHPFIDGQWKGAIKVTKDTIERPIDLTKDMSKEELTKYVEREWNGEKYQAGKK